MKARELFWAKAVLVFAVIVLVGSGFAQARSEERATTTPLPTGERTDIAPLESRAEDGMERPEVDITPIRSFSGGDEPAPTIPGEAMDTESRDIYIYVTLLAPPGPEPPETVKIISKECDLDFEEVEFKADILPGGYFGDFYNVYRDTLPLFFMSQLDTSSTTGNRIGRTSILFFTDDFTDPFWPLYWTSSKGVCDTLVNMFYVFTTVDTGASAPGGYAESSYPSWCMGEFDQALYTDAVYGTQNWISIPNIDENFPMGSDLDGHAITQINEWDPEYQIPDVVASKHPIFGWITDGPLQLNHCYQVVGTHGSTPDVFQTYTPGILSEQDSVYSIHFSTIYGGRNIIMLPFHAVIVENITNRAMFESSIEDAGSSVSARLMRIDVWDASAFFWSPIASYNAIFDMWTGNPHMAPGKVYRIWLESDPAASFSFTWPFI